MRRMNDEGGEPVLARGGSASALMSISSGDRPAAPVEPAWLDGIAIAWRAIPPGRATMDAPGSLA